MNPEIGKVSRLGVAAKKKKAAERFSKVRELKKKGLSAKRILETLNADGADWKIRTIYEDFKKIKQVEARDAKKCKAWLDYVNRLSRNHYTLTLCITQLNSYGFTIDPKKVTTYAQLEKEVENSINADIHDNIRRVS